MTHTILRKWLMNILFERGLDRNLPLQPSDYDYPDSATLCEREDGSHHDSEDITDIFDNLPGRKTFPKVSCIITCTRSHRGYRIYRIWISFLDDNQLEEIFKQLQDIALGDNSPAISEKLKSIALVSFSYCLVKFQKTDFLDVSAIVYQTELGEGWCLGGSQTLHHSREYEKMRSSNCFLNWTGHTEPSTRANQRIWLVLGWIVHKIFSKQLPREPCAEKHIRVNCKLTA